ncbi:hypothetical protein GCM10025794_01250 [Massilia kyonggiensis]
MDQLQCLASDLKLAVLREVTGHNAVATARWVDDLVEETFSEAPRLFILRIFLDEIQKKAPPSHALAEKIEVIKRMVP